MEDDAEVQTRLVPVGERTIVVKKLTKIQMAIMLRGVRILRSNVDDDKKHVVVDEFLQILDSVVVGPEDKAYVRELQLTGGLDVEDMVSWVSVFEEEDGAEKKPTVRRGRARR